MLMSFWSIYSFGTCYGMFAYHMDRGMPFSGDGRLQASSLPDQPTRPSSLVPNISHVRTPFGRLGRPCDANASCGWRSGGAAGLLTNSSVAASKTKETASSVAALLKQSIICLLGAR